MSYLHKIQAADPRPPVRKQAEEKEPATDVLRTGQILSNKKGRLADIQSWNPFLFIVSGVGAPGILNFFKKAAPTINDPTKVERIAGPNSIGAKNKSPLELTFAYLVPRKVSEELTARANSEKLSVYSKPFNLDSSSPFQEIKLPMEGKLGNEAYKFRTQMLDSYNKLKGAKESTKKETIAIPAMQIPAFIPLDYLRWLTKNNKKHKLYLYQKMVYVLCSKEESDFFIKTAKEFKTLPAFLEKVEFVSDIDSDLKTTKPKEFTPDNCIFLVKKKAFDINKELPALDAIVDDLSNQKLPKGKLVAGTHVQGDLAVHFNADKHKCVLWGRRLKFSSEQEKEMTTKLGLQYIETTFIK